MKATIRGPFLARGQIAVDNGKARMVRTVLGR